MTEKSVLKTGHMIPTGFYPELLNTIERLESEFDQITGERKGQLRELSSFITHKLQQSQVVPLIFICTHNSRRSHISQIWCSAAAHYYQVPAVESYSGGTEATAFNERAVKALSHVGFRITRNNDSANPLYEVSFSKDAAPLPAFSKRYDHEANPKSDFAAVMTCTHADENCPIVIGMEKRIALPFDDPKDFDGTDLEESKYLERVNQIGREMLYAFSQVTSK